MARRIMREFRIGEISGVDNPAQAHARTVIMKRADLEKKVYLTALAGLDHQHVINDYDWNGQPVDGGDTSWVKSSQDTNDGAGHSHPWVRLADGSIEIGMAEGHTHTVLEPQLFASKAQTKTEGGEQFTASDYAYVPDASSPDTWKLRLAATPGGGPDAGIVGAAAAALGPGYRGEKVQIPSDDRPAVIRRVKSAWRKANPDKKDDAMPDVLKALTNEEETDAMTPDETKRFQDMEASVTKLTGELDLFKALAGMSDAQKAYYGTLDQPAKDRFVKMSPEDRQSATDNYRKTLSDANPVVYTNAAGEEFRKDDDARLIAMAKQADLDRKERLDAVAKAEAAELTKKAEDTLGHLPGDVAKVKVPLLKAINKLDDEANVGALAILKVAEDQASGSFKVRGTERGADLGKTSGPDAQLNKLAEDHAKANNVTFAKAYEAVLGTPEGQKLYDETHGSAAAA